MNVRASHSVTKEQRSSAGLFRFNQYRLLAVVYLMHKFHLAESSYIMYYTDATEGGLWEEMVHAHGQQIVHYAPLRAESGKSNLDKEMDQTNQGVDIEGQCRLVKDQGRTKTGERLAGEEGNTYTLSPDTNATTGFLGPSCSAIVAASCHNTKLYDDNRWNTLLEVTRQSDGTYYKEGWWTLPMTQEITFPVETYLVLIRFGS